MEFSLDHRTASLSVGEFAGFALGPREGGEGGSQGVWRAQLGTQWHQELRRRTADDIPAAAFEVVVTGRVFHSGWTLTLTGRIDQLLPATGDRPTLLREIKTVTSTLPAAEEELRAEYADYFAQLATYLSLQRLSAPDAPLRGELLFVETASGLTQPVALSPADETLFGSRLERVTQFLNLRLRARERLRGLDYRPAFATRRAGQETTLDDLTTALARSRIVTFEAPTGFGKTGILLECALAQLKSGRFSRLLYLTSKSTGQLQVMHTLRSMTEVDRVAPNTLSGQPETQVERVVPNAFSEHAPPPVGVAAWHVRNKAEHCVNHEFRCTRETCGYLNGAAARWPQSGLSRFYLIENEPHDLESLRTAGRAAQICPYEITRTALAFNDVWIGDYNYVFSPRNRGLFHDQPGFDPAETLLVLDEAHNLAARVADAHSHVVLAGDAQDVLAELEHQHAPAPLRRSWDAFTRLLTALPATEALDPHQEDDLRDSLATLAQQVQLMSLDYAALAPRHAELLWLIPELAAWLDDSALERLLWCPRGGELRFTCLDAAPVIGGILRSYGNVVLASATIGRANDFAQAIGLAEPAPNKLPDPGEVAALTAHTPWRDRAYDIAYDARVDTTYRERERHHSVTAATIDALHDSIPLSVGIRCVAVFFPSYRYAESIRDELDRSGSILRVALQPRLPDLAGQIAWMEESLAFADALFLVLGSSFAEGIDLLGGRVSRAMVVGPALPEVNAVQRARMEAHRTLGRDSAFRRVYQIPGMQKVNQALGRLVRAPGQRAKVLLHCHRFTDPDYARLLARDYQFGTTITTDAELAAWCMNRN